MADQDIGVDYWPVDSSVRRGLALNLHDIYTHVCADWHPWTPPPVDNAVDHWPAKLLDVVERDSLLPSLPGQLGLGRALALSPHAQSCERQWKTVMSWILGVAGARQVLKDEGYVWIAPASAFRPTYRGAIPLMQSGEVSLPAGLLTAETKPADQNRSKYLPDYLVIRRGEGELEGGEWAVVEAKGNKKSFGAGDECPPAWKCQARNIAVSVDGEEVDVARHMVIATRVNPVPQNVYARQLTIRAWNESKEAKPDVAPAGEIDIMTMHVFGALLRFRQEGLARRLSDASGSWVLNRKSPRADGHQEKSRSQRAEVDDPPPVKRFEVKDGAIEVELTEPLMRLARDLSDARTYEEAGKLMLLAEGDLKELEQVAPLDGQAANFGVLCRFVAEKKLERHG